MRRVKPVLQLVRLPNVFTAAADSLAGFLIVGGRLDDFARWLPLAGASMALYAAGMALNDWFDLEVDRSERPGRPLPSGTVPVGLAAALGWGGLALGLALAVAAGGVASPIFATAAALAAAIVGYNAGLKHTSLGPWTMGSCRALNLLMGAASAPEFGGPRAWEASAAFGAFVAGVTWISRSEAFGGGRRNLQVGLALQGIALVGLLDAASRLAVAPPSTGRPSLLIAQVILGLVLGKTAAVGLRAISDPTADRIRAAVKSGVLSLVWLDVALVASARGPTTALAVAALWPPAFLLARRLYAT